MLQYLQTVATDVIYDTVTASLLTLTITAQNKLFYTYHIKVAIGYK